MLKKIALAVAAVIVVVTLAIVYYSMQQVPPGEVIVTTVGQVVRMMKGGGRVEGIGEKTLAFGMGGRIDEVVVKESQEVALNDDIAVLNPSDVESQIVQAQAALAEAQAQLEAAKAGSWPEVIHQAEEKLEQATADVQAAAAKLKALQDPLPPAPATAAQLEDAQRAIEVARLQHEETVVALNQLISGPSQDSLAVARTKVTAAETELENAVKRLDAFGKQTNIFGQEKRAEEKAKLEADVDQKRTALQIARAEFDKENRGPRREQIRAAEIKVALAQKAVQAAEATKARLEKPEPTRATPPVEIEQAKANLRRAESIARERRAELDKLKRGPDPAQIKIAEAALSRAEAVLNYKKLLKEGLRLRASSDGLIVKKHVESGMMIGPNQPVITMVDFSERRVRAEFDVGRMADIQPGLPVIIKSRALKEPLDGKVIETGRVGARRLFSDDPNAPRGGEVVEVLIAITPPKSGLKQESYKLLRPNITVDAEIIIEKKENVLVVPKSYVSQENGKEYVLRLEQNAANGANEAPKIQYIKTGLRDEYYVEVVSGLSDGDKLTKPRAANGK